MQSSLHRQCLRWNLALSQLRNGDIEEAVYEIDLTGKIFPPIRKFKNAQKLLPDVDPNARIMLWFEQGIGDQLRFWSIFLILKNITLT